MGNPRGSVAIEKTCGADAAISSTAALRTSGGVRSPTTRFSKTNAATSPRAIQAARGGTSRILHERRGAGTEFPAPRGSPRARPRAAGRVSAPVLDCVAAHAQSAADAPDADRVHLVRGSPLLDGLRVRAVD